MKRGDIVAIRDSSRDPWSDEIGLVFTYAHSKRRMHHVVYPDGVTLEKAKHVKPVPRIKQ